MGSRERTVGPKERGAGLQPPARAGRCSRPWPLPTLGDPGRPQDTSHSNRGERHGMGTPILLPHTQLRWVFSLFATLQVCECLYPASPTGSHPRVPVTSQPQLRSPCGHPLPPSAAATRVWLLCPTELQDSAWAPLLQEPSPQVAVAPPSLRCPGTPLCHALLRASGKPVEAQENSPGFFFFPLQKFYNSTF